MAFEELGFTKDQEEYGKENNLDSFEIGRISLEHKERYVIITPNAEFDAELIGNLRYTAESRYDFPAVGDWVAFSEYDDGKALIHAIYPRSTILERQEVGKSGQVQIIATNVDYALIVQAVDRDFNINRLERYLTICNAASIEPIIILSKVDLLNQVEIDEIIQSIHHRITDVAILRVSNQEKGYVDLEAIIQKGKTYCLLGSSGVGKSTILNSLSGEEHMETGAISTSVNKGKHVTSHRELTILKNGGILIDNPGMREVGIADTTGGLEKTFESILEYTEDCRFNDCTHTNETGCAVIAALENGEINEDAYANFRKIEKEKMHFESDAQERKKKDKDLGKLIKRVVKQRKKNKF